MEGKLENDEDVGEWQRVGCIKISGCNDTLDIIMGCYPHLAFHCPPTPTRS